MYRKPPHKPSCTHHLTRGFAQDTTFVSHAHHPIADVAMIETQIFTAILTLQKTSLNILHSTHWNIRPAPDLHP